MIKFLLNHVIRVHDITYLELNKTINVGNQSEMKTIRQGEL